MSNIDIARSDALRTLNDVLNPDCRMEAFVLVEEAQIRSMSLADRHSAIASFELNPTAPSGVRIHFETAKNLYLYSWFVYRFHAVAEQQALVSLEFALRERILELRLTGETKVKRMGLSALLKFARDNALIRNAAILSRITWATEKARRRYSFAMIEEMARQGISEMQFDDSKILPTEEDLACDWISNFIEYLPDIRNDYAHGSETLRHAVLRTFDISCDLINQLFPAEASLSL